ncbi:MAG: deoxyribonuclease IV [Planctomycetota bacterium]
MGADGYVLHPGSARGQPADRCIEAAADILRQALDEATAAPPLLLENTATEHGPGGRLEWLARLAEELEAGAGRAAVGVCLDTCHLFAAGYDVRDEAEVDRLLETIEATVGTDRVRLLHVNDARDGPGTGRDRHEHIGEGRIGRGGLRNVLLHPALRGTPAILETPWVSPEVDRENLQAVRDILGGGTTE